MKGGIYDAITGLRIDTPQSSDQGETSDKPGSPCYLYEKLNEDIFRQVLQHFPAVRSRVLLSHICHSWRYWVGISWSQVELKGPELPRQLSWIRKQPCQDILQELKIAGRRAGNAPLQRLDLSQTLEHFSHLKALILCPNGGYAVTQQHILAMAGLAELTSLQTQYTVPNVHQDATLEEFAPLQGLKHLDIAFLQPAVASLSTRLSALSRLTFLALEGLLHFKQEGDYSGGAMGKLMEHLSQLNLQVAGDLDLEMHGPHLESLRLSYGQAICRAPAKLPQLRCLYQETPSLRASDLHSCRNLERVELGTFCKVGRSQIQALSRCHALKDLLISQYVPDAGPFSMEEFACLTSLRNLDLKFTANGNKCYMTPGLSALNLLSSLTLCPSTNSSLCGSIEHAPNLRRLKLASTSRSSLLHSKTLTSLIIGSHNGYGYPPEELILVGCFPALQELHLSDMLEGDAGLRADPRSRFQWPHSLQSLQVITVDLAYSSVADPLSTYRARSDHDITYLLIHIREMCPRLKALKVTAMRRDVMIDVDRMPLQHLALACKTLNITTSAKNLTHNKAQTSSSIPSSLHFLFEAGTKETEQLLTSWGARKSLVSTGDLYLNRELQEWKLGEPHPHDLATHAAFGSLKTVYDDGFYL